MGGAGAGGQLFKEAFVVGLYGLLQRGDLGEEAAACLTEMATKRMDPRLKVTAESLSSSQAAQLGMGSEAFAAERMHPRLRVPPAGRLMRHARRRADSSRVKGGPWTMSRRGRMCSRQGDGIVLP